MANSQLRKRRIIDIKIATPSAAEVPRLSVFRPFTANTSHSQMGLPMRQREFEIMDFAMFTARPRFRIARHGMLSRRLAQAAAVVTTGLIALPALAQDAVAPSVAPAMPLPPATGAAPAATGMPAAGLPATGLPGAGLPAVGTPDAIPPISATALLPHDLSPMGMFMAADWVVKSVMVGLLLASLATWTVWLAKSIELATNKRRARNVRATVTAADQLGQAAERTGEGRDASAALVRAAAREARVSDGLDASGIKERIQIELQRIEVAAGRRISRGTGILATIGAIAPFIGLFGTVWGIMNSFIGIARAQTTNLAVVAPGIAEALLATAIGLVAAIPAVVIYNIFTRSIGGYRAQLSDVTAQTIRLVSRDLDRRAAAAQQGFRPRQAAE